MPFYGNTVHYGTWRIVTDSAPRAGWRGCYWDDADPDGPVYTTPLQTDPAAAIKVAKDAIDVYAQTLKVRSDEEANG
jgi:hypothetical protein